MLYRSYVPGPPLSDFVELLRLYDGYQQPHARERLLPDGSMELVFNLSENKIRVHDSAERTVRTRGSLVIGAQTEYFVIDTAGDWHSIRPSDSRLTSFALCRSCAPSLMSRGRRFQPEAVHPALQR